MIRILRVITQRWLTTWFVWMLTSILCYGHDWSVHMRITTSASGASDGLQKLLGENLESQTLTASQPQISGSFAPITWLAQGSYFEDEQVYYMIPHQRCLDHFYTVIPERTPGQVIGLTDWSEPAIIGGLFSTHTTNSFVWASKNGIKGPYLIGTNVYRWEDARNYEFAALTSTNQSDRNENMALMLYTLGHILHLNQDLTSPDHVRNDNHYSKAWIEDYGKANYTKNQNLQWFAAPANHGWSYWQSQGFTNLLNFWDTGKYACSSSDALVQEAAGNIKLGLAEFCNGNFLGEDALYNEAIGSDVIHSFPFPSLYSGTTFPSIRSHLAAGTVTSFLKDGKPINRIAISKTIHDGIPITHHSVLNYLGAVFPRKAAQIAKVAITVNDSSVLQDYHNILIPKAVEYSTGILDYFFRGTMDVTVSWGGTNAPNFTNTVLNTSGQDFHGGTFYVLLETNQVRSILLETNLADVLMDPDASFTNGTSLDILCDGQPTNKLLLVYQGTIGWSNDAALDPVDANIGIAAARPWFKQIKTYDDNLVWLKDVGLPDGATTNGVLDSDDFPFTLTLSNCEVEINSALFDDTGSIGSVSAQTLDDTFQNCGWSNSIANTVVPIGGVSINPTDSSRLRVAISATDDASCNGQIGWANVSITWRAWPGP